jgi:hypothetical protein
VPYPLHFSNIVGAEIGVTKLDPQTGRAEVVVNRNFSPTLVKPVSIQTQTTYITIYLPG